MKTIQTDGMDAKVKQVKTRTINGAIRLGWRTGKFSFSLGWLVIVLLLRSTVLKAEQCPEIVWWKGGAGTDAVAFSPDGNVFATADSETVKLWRASDGRLLHTRSITSSASSITFTTNGTLVSGSYDGTVRFWQVPDGNLSWVITNQFPWLRAIAVSPNGSLVACASGSPGWPSEYDGTVTLLNASDGSLVRVLTNGTMSATAIMFSPDGSLLAATFADSMVAVWQVSDGTLQHVWNDGYASDAFVTFSPDGQALLTGGGSDYAYVKLRRVSDGQQLWVSQAYATEIYSACFSPDGNMIATGGGRAGVADPAIKLWNTSDGSLLYSMLTNGSYVAAVSFAPDGATLVSGSVSIDFWSVTNGTQLLTLTGHNGVVTAATFSWDGRMVASGGSDGTVRLWQATNGTPLQTLLGLQGVCTGIAFPPDSLTVVGGGNSARVCCWHTSDGTQVWANSTYPWQITCLAGSCSNEFFAVGESFYGELPCQIELRRYSDGQLINTLTGHSNIVASVCFSPDGMVLASGSQDQTVRLWQMPDGNALRTIPVDSAVTAVAFSPDGTLIATGGSNALVRIWRVADGGFVRTFTGHQASIISVAFSPNGESLISAGADATLRVWRLCDGTLLTTYDSEVMQTGCLAMAPNARLFAYGRQDGVLVAGRLPAILDPLSLATSGGMRFLLYGLVGQNYTVQNSSDLMHWIDWIVVTPTNGCTVITDPTGYVPSAKFYRTKIPE
ncbi:MAG: WD40 repeat domain-containing protein [Verrucomicrobiota bacterium]